MKHTPEPWFQPPCAKIVTDKEGGVVGTFARPEDAARCEQLTRALSGVTDPAAFVEAVDRARFVLERVASCGCADDFKRVGTKHCILRGEPSPCIFCVASAALAKLEEVRR